MTDRNDPDFVAKARAMAEESGLPLETAKDALARELDGHGDIVVEADGKLIEPDPSLPEGWLKPRPAKEATDGQRAP